MGRRKTTFTDLPPRMTARRLASGRLLYYYQAGGRKVPLGDNLTAAKLEWARLDAGAAKVLLFPAVVTAYRRAMFPGFTLSTQRHYEIAFGNLVEAFSAFALEQIEPRHVKAYMRARSKKGAGAFEKRVLSALFNWARGEGLTSAANPCRDIRWSGAERRAMAPGGKRKRYVSDAEFAEVYARADELVRDAMDLALLTGQRPSDLLKARRQDIVDGVLWIVQEKTGQRVGIKVEGELAGVLERIQTRPRAVPSMYLLADRRGQRVRYNVLNARFRAARGEADWQFRDLRAKAASDSPDLKQAQQLLGHADETTTAGVYRRTKGAIVAPLKR